MIHAAAKCSRAASATIRSRSISVRSLIRHSTPLRLIHAEISVPNANHVAIQMVNYALSHARSLKSDESYSQGMLVLEQCLGNQLDDDQASQDSKATVLLAMSDLLYESGNSGEAIERLKEVMTLTQSSLNIRVAALEALVGLLIQSGQDDASLDVADEFLQLVNERVNEHLQDVVATAKAIKGFVELVKGRTESAEFLFQGLEEREICKGTHLSVSVNPELIRPFLRTLNNYINIGNIALSYGEFLHATGKFEMAKKMYQKAIQGMTDTKESLCSCNTSLKAVSLAATFALGQLESHIGNFGDAEETLTNALTSAEEHYGHKNPKVGVILTGVALMYRNKAMQERSSSILIQEGLFRKALDLMKVPPLDSEGITNMETQEVMSLARGGYAELLLIQENRKSEGEKYKSWAESAWKNKRISLPDALTTLLGDKVAIIDARTNRVL